MNKFFRTFLNALRQTQQALEALEASGVDVDRLVGISNAQGPQAKLIQALLSGSMRLDGLSAEEMAHIPMVKQLPRKTRSSKKKREP
jgi:hypothetical protein